jgi:hypothetical protein
MLSLKNIVYTRKQQMDSLTLFRINSPKVIHETIDGETVIVNLDSGNYYSLDTIGADIWDSVGKGVPIAHIIEDISCRYTGEREEIDQAVRLFVNELLQEALISPLESGRTVDVYEIPVKTEHADGLPDFKAPILQKYSDMQDLLLLDPIHEVDDTGWPNVKTENA